MDDFIIWLLILGCFYVFYNFVIEPDAENDNKDENKPFKINKKDIPDMTDEDLKKCITINDYWSSIIAGDLTLENGEKFDFWTFYNPKHLKISLEKIKLGVFATYIYKIKGTSNEKKWSDAAISCSMYYANFEKEGVKDKIATSTAEMGEIFKTSLTKDDIQKTAAAITKASTKTKDKLDDELFKRQMVSMKKMKALIENSKKEL